jgi:hypothetical protein
MTTTQQPMKLAIKCVYCGSVKHEAREASGTCIQELIYALNDSVKRERVLREAMEAISQRHPGYGGSGEIARKALAATGIPAES